MRLGIVLACVRSSTALEPLCRRIVRHMRRIPARPIHAKRVLCVCAQVSYVEKRPQLPTSLFYRMVRAQRAGEPFGDLADEIFSLSYLHKSAEWSYEKEARIYYPFS